MKNNIVLGITGGIAAYKMAQVASTLTKRNYNVKVVMTESAAEFIKPLTFRSLTGNPVNIDLFSPPEHHDIKHVSLAKWADVILIAPATANFIGKIAGGIADDLLTTIVMATTATKMIAPAMNVNMLNNPIVRENIDYLQDKEYQIITPESGYLACGDRGEGRLPEPQNLVELIEIAISKKNLASKKILVTAGPTREPIDPVRFITNYSSGKMGYELARMAVRRGADVTLISGPTHLKPPLNTNFIEVNKAREMQKEVLDIINNQQIVIKAAAVTDYRPTKYSKQKIKKDNDSINKIDLENNPDILQEIGNQKKDEQFIVGFAAESDNLIDNAEKKLKKKNLDMIIVNDISREDIGFGSENNEVTLITRDIREKLPVMKKRRLAEIILDKIVKMVK
ncbi:MAG: bifunctional phosphopantothenoylcysteine decarboxylase/phosphopantothenate--cysteine ligase CoaBC [Halanaerobiales bacterium]